MPMSCDCDECGTCQAKIPPSIAQAVIEHRRSKLFFLENAPTFQERTLVARDGSGSGVSIWKLVLPPGSEPLTEFGNSHRIIFVESMPKGRTVRSIGKGIIGSGDEQNSRQKVPWVETHAYLYCSNGGKAIGWVNEKQELDKSLHIDDTNSDVVLYVVKVTNKAIAHCLKTSIDEAPWTLQVKQIFQKHLGEKRCDNNDEATSGITNALPAQDAVAIRHLVDTGSQSSN